MRPKVHGVCTRAGKNGAHVGGQEDAEWLAREATANGWVYVTIGGCCARIVVRSIL